MPRFITRSATDNGPDSPESLFRTLRPQDGGVRHLWAHQADILRAYQSQAGRATDVAVELPTGAGKTLVGLLLGDYRRRALRHRVAYLCPTIQLANQAATRAAGYGIFAVLLTGRQAEYPVADFQAYNRAQALAITTYSAVFNSHPRIDASQTLVLDDAHAAEGPVSSMWSVMADRGDDALYQPLLDVLIAGLPPAFAERMRDDALDPVRRNEVELVSPQHLASSAELVREVLDTHAPENVGYAARQVSDYVGHCLAYVSWGSILIRPLIPPSISHRPFSSAAQRIYMSATLGAGGELERAFGVPTILRLPVPQGWDEHGSGRRFFLFPNASLDQAETDEFVTRSMARAGKAMVLAPSNWEAERFSEACMPSGFTQMGPSDIAQTTEPFVRRDRVALVLANRYDGIDLPDDACRLVVLTGLPSGTHLQERFLFERLGAKRVISERIRTRIIQGAGRCTRNAQDFAAVVVRGQRLLDYLSREENLVPMHPTFQAEIEFGLVNSETAGVDLDEILRSFLDQDDDWRAADKDILARAVGRERAELADESQLSIAARIEVMCWQAVSMVDMEEAVRLAQQIVDALEGGAELRPYRCLWLYLAASWARELVDGVLPPETASALANDAVACSRHLSWRPAFQRDEALAARGSSDVVPQRSFRAANVLLGLGIRGATFERHLAAVENMISLDEAASFEKGVTAVGDLLGFDAVRPSGSAQPDSAWRDEGKCSFIFEAKTESDASIPISVAEVRQALTHPAWVASNLNWSEPPVTILISPKTTVDTTAAGLAGTTFAASPRQVRELAADTFSALRAVRGLARGLGESELADALNREFLQRHLDTETLQLAFMNSPVARLRQVGPRSHD